LDTFKDVFTQVTKSHGCLVLNNRSVGDGFLDKVFWYRASATPPDMNMYGNKQYKYLHEKNYNKYWEDDALDKESKFNILDFAKKKNHKMAIVNKISEDDETK